MNNINLIKYYVIKDELNIEQIVKDYSGYVYKIIDNNSNNFSNEDIEEIISDTFFILWKNQKELDVERSLSSYIAGITRNLIKQKNKKMQNFLDIDDYIDKVDSKINLENLYHHQEKIDFLANSLNKMKQDDVEIFQYFYYSGKTVKEIAIMMNLSEFSVKSKLYRTRKKLRNKLEKGGYRNG